MTAGPTRTTRVRTLPGLSNIRDAQNLRGPGGRFLQGGLHGSDVPTLPPVKHESPAATGLRHVPGALSMARWEPGTATSEFLICLTAVPEYDEGDGYAVFGHVESGLDVVAHVAALPTTSDGPLPFLRHQMLERPVAFSARPV